MPEATTDGTGGRKGSGMIGSLGWQELLIILVILALLFGASRVAGLGGALGKGIREFRTEARGTDDEKKEKEEATASNSKSKDEDATSSG